MRNKKEICKQIEQLILNKNSADISKSENAEIQEHLKLCRSCRNFNLSVSRLKENLGYKKNREVFPRLSDFKYLQQKVKEKRTKKKILFENIASAITDYRIISAAAAIIILILAINFLPIEKTATQLSSAADLNISYPFNVIDSLNTHEMQNIGRSAKDDSVLTSFAVSSI